MEKDRVARSHLAIDLLEALFRLGDALAIGIDLGHEAEIAAPALLTPAADSAVVVLDARDADWAASRPSGWQSAALEGVRLSIVDRAHPLNLQP